MTRPTSIRNFSTFFFLRITQTERIASDLLLFLAKKKNGRRRNGGGGKRGRLPCYNRWIHQRILATGLLRQ